MNVNANLVKNYTDGMRKALDERYWNYSNYILGDIAQRSFKAKATLYELFSKHPNWNPEKGYIQFDANINRPFSRNAIRYFLSTIDRMIGYNEIKVDIPVDKWTEIYGALWDIDSQYLKDCSTGDIAEYLNQINENYRIRPEMRASKVIGKVFRTEGLDTQIPDYGKLFSSMSDDINPLVIKRHTVISLNPVDYLLMSNGDTWKSCHNIEDADDPGCYSAGTISYMLDENSFIFYTVDASYDGSEIEFEEKASRQVFAYKDGVLFQSRMYPQSCDCGAEEMYKDTREIVQKIVSECEGFNNLWITTKSDVNDFVKLGDGACCYPDWHRGCPGGDHCRVSRQKETETSHVKIKVGKRPICIQCGEEHENHNTINHCDAYFCTRCGYSVDRDDVYWCGDDPYCGDCVSYCEKCCEYYPKDNVTETYHGTYVCSDCLAEYYYYCEDLEDYVSKDYAVEFENGYFYSGNEDNEWAYCSKCGEAHWISDLTYSNGEYYCEDCYEDIEE